MNQCVLFIKSSQVPSISNIFSYTHISEKCFSDFGLLSQRNRDLLIREGFVEVKKPVLSDGEREEFLKSYIDLIGQVSHDNHSLLWWATDLASRSRFCSLVPDQIYIFLTVVRMAKQSTAKLFVVIDAPDSILCSFKKAMSFEAIDIKAPVYVRRYWCMRIHAFWHRIASVIWNILRTSYRIFWMRRYLSNILKEFNNQSQTTYYAIKTFIYNQSFDAKGNYHDSFFGRLPEFLGSSRSVLIFANILGDLKHCLTKIRECRHWKIIPLELMLTYRDVYYYGLQILFFRTKIPKLLMFQGHDISDILDYEQKRTHDKIQPYQLFHYPATRCLVQTFKLNHFAHTFENYPWERMCLMAVHDRSPGTQCVGYQHAIVPQSAVGMFASKRDTHCLPKPDRILTTGEAPKKILQRYGCWNGLPLAEVGVMRSSYLFGLNAYPRLKTKKILVALEGIFEVYKMFNYVVSQMGNTDYQLIVRTHPVLPLEMIAHKLNFRISDYANIEFSHGLSVKEDIERSGIIVYWGTSLCIDGLWLGRPVVHYHTGTVLKYDPIFECNHLKWTVSNETNMHHVIKDIERMDDQTFQNELHQAQEYVYKYFHPATDESLANFII